MATTKDKKNPNYRPRDSKGHYLKTGSSKKTAKKASQKPSKETAASAHKHNRPANGKRQDGSNDSFTMGCIAFGKMKMPAYLKINGTPYVDLRIHGAILDSFDSLLKDKRISLACAREEIAKKDRRICELTNAAINHHRKYNTLSENYARVVSRLGYMKRRANFYRIKIAVAACSFFALGVALTKVLWK